MFDIIVLVISLVTMAVLGLFVVARNFRDTTYQLFGLLTIASIVWFIANFASNYVHGYNSQLFTNKLSLFCGFLLIVSLWLLSLYFPRKTRKHSLQKWFVYIATPIVLFITLFTSNVVSSVAYNAKENLTTINTGSLYIVYIIAAIIFFGFLVYNFFLSYKSKLLNHLQHQQVLYAAIGMLLAFVWGILSAALIPSITHNWQISKLSASAGVFIVGFVSYAIIAHKLFDIRLVVARSVGYILTLAAVALVFIVPSIVIITTIFHTNLPSRSIILLILITLLIASLFQFLRSTFNKLTNRFFYRDYYEIQDVLDKLGDLLVRSVDPQEILSRSASILSQAIRPTSFKYLLIDQNTKHTTQESGLLNSLNKVRTNITFVDESESQSDKDVYDLLLTNDIAMSVKLRTKDEQLGYMLVGYKQSGQIFTDIDKRLLTIAADEIAISLQNALRFEEIERFNITLQDKVDEATIKLRRANDKLRALDETKDDFISMASHQLRTPLTSVKGYVSMVLDGDVGKITKAQKDMLNQAFFSSQRMVYIIADLLNVSRLKTGKFIIERNPINLAKIIQQELSQVEEIASSKGIKIVYEKPDNFPVLMLDETKTRQAIMNFVDNAIYYTAAGGEIKIRLLDYPQTIELRVVDNGIGVPKNEQHHLFTKFYRAGNARKARPDGTGLGLFMAKKVILAEGGSILFESQEGKGSTFGFVFSKAKIKPSGNKPVLESSETKELAEV